MAARLVAVSGPLRGAVLQVPDRIVIGRDPKSEVSLDDRSVSRRHCEIAIEGDKFQIKDLGSANQTYVNGLPVRDWTALAMIQALRAAQQNLPSMPFQLPDGSDMLARMSDAKIVRDAASLARWEAAWRGDEPALDLFRPALLRESDHAFIAVAVEGRIVAGCVASRSDAVVGISNLFGPAEHAPQCLAGSSAAGA